MALNEQTVSSRRDALQAELEKIYRHIESLARQRSYAEQQALRIGGAIRILEELLQEDATPGEHRESSPVRPGPVAEVA